MTCPSCSAEIPAGARFCPACGQPLHAPGDERRVVTVLFGDIVGFTALSESRDPEQVKNVVDRCFARLAADIRDFGGTLDKVVGDAVVALFGAPVAHEDDAERAVRAALRMQRTLSNLGDKELGAPVQMRIGINTGEVLVGALRAGGDYTAMGDVVNTASRLQTMAEPGQVVVGPGTHAATTGVFLYEPLGALHARGREAKVEAWVAVEAVLQPGRRPPRRVSSRLVGRDRELELLERVVSTAFATRRPTLIALLGEAGVGKSRLAEEVVLRAMGASGARVLSGRAVPYGAANVWWPIAEVMRAACGVGPDDSPDVARDRCVQTVSALLGADADSDEVGRVVDALMYLIGIGASQVDVDSKRAQDEVSRAVRTFIEALASRQPLIFTLGDMQWADPSVLTGLDELLGRLRRVPLVVVVTARPGLEQEWRPAAGHRNLVVLQLEPLDAAAAGDLLVSLLGRDPGPAVRHELVERSGGNPLFVEELAALVAERDTAVDSLPATLRGIVAARLDALVPGERAVLDDAAVVGRRAPMTVLLAIGGSRGGVAEAVDALVAKDLLVVDDGWCEFRSDLVREVVYGMLTKAERARRHAALAGWLEAETSGAPSDEALGEVGRHWATAAELDAELGGIDGVPSDVRDLAVAALAAAAERFEGRELHVAAERIHDRLVRLLGDEPSPERRLALVGRARAATALRHDEAATADLDVATAEARRAGDDDALGRALTVRGDLLRNTGAFDASLAALEEARRLFRQVGDRRGEGSALRRIGWTKLFSGDLDGAEPVLLEALEAFRESGAQRGEAWVHQNLAWVSYGKGEIELAEQRLVDSIERFRRIGDWGGLNWTTGMLGWVRFRQGRIEEAEQHTREAWTEATEQGDTWQVGMMQVLQASIRLWQGRAEEAVELAGAARQTFLAVGDVWSQGQAAGPLLQALLLTGRFDEADRLLAEVVGRRGRGPVTYGVFSTLTSAIAAVLTGQPELAMAALAEDETVPGDVRFGSRELLVARGLALLQLGRVDDSVSLLGATVAAGGEADARSASRAALALALAAAGRTGEAAAAAREVADLGGSYLDRVMADVAAAAAAARDGDATAVAVAIDRATRLVGSTQDRLTAALVARARALVLEAVGDPFAAGAGADAERQFRELGIDATGWDTALRLAAGLRPAAEQPLA